MIDTYSAALAFIHGRTQFKKAPTLSRMRNSYMNWVIHS